MEQTATDRKCAACGHTWPWQTKQQRCPICGLLNNTGPCRKCGAFCVRTGEGQMLCTECARASYRKRYARSLEKTEILYRDWLAQIKRIPEPYHMLTQDEWIRACQHFGGCAMCGSPRIDVQTMFIRFKDGGRYTAWNIIPTCERCASVSKEQVDNPFRATELIAVKYTKQTHKTFNKSVDYLQERINDATRESKDKNEDTE